MRSTELSLLLPTPVNRAALRGFWLIISLAIALVVTLTTRALGLGDEVATVTTLGVVYAIIAVPVLLRPSLAWTPYRAWNWIVRRFSGPAIRAVSSVAFHLVMRPLSATTAAHQFRRQSSSTTWEPRVTQSVETYPSTHYDENGAQEDMWGSLSSWRRISDHRPAVLLIPYVALIRLLDVEPAAKTDAPSDIYTLY